MANPPPPYANITGISRTVMKDNAQETVTNYDGNARPGEMVVNLLNNDIYIGNTDGNLSLISTGGGGAHADPSGPVSAIQINAGGNLFTGSANLTFLNNIMNVVGNINASYFIGDGSQLTNLPIQSGTYSNSNVANYLPTYSGNISGGNITVSGNVTANYGVFSGGNTVINAGISTTGNITGNYILGNGSQLTGIISTGITTILPNALSNTTHIAANTVGNTATIITDATTANTANTIVVRDQYGAINVNAWAVNTKLTAISYTATTSDYWIGCTAKTLTITLPNAANGAYNGRQYQIADTVHSGNPNDTITAQSPATVTGNPSITQQGQIVLATYINGVWYCN